ncbi:MAG: four helix bundle protein [Ignavibacteriaceae bacterium]
MKYTSIMEFKVFEKEIGYGNAILDKSFDFGVRIENLYKYLISKDYKFETIFKQKLRSGTSIGANIAEAQYASSKKDFLNKFYISLKETSETKYWLKLLHATEFIKEDEFKDIYKDCEEVSKILTSIIKTLKK